MKPHFQKWLTGKLTLLHARSGGWLGRIASDLQLWPFMGRNLPYSTRACGRLHNEQTDNTARADFVVAPRNLKSP